MDGLDCECPPYLSSEKVEVNKNHSFFTLPNYEPLESSRLPIHLQKLASYGRKRKSMRMGGVGTMDYRFPNVTISNLETALVTRVFGVKHEGRYVKCPQPEPGIFDTLDQRSQEIIAHCKMVPPISSEKFVLCYQGRQRTVYENALKSFTTKPFSYKDARIRSFVKVERMLAGKDPRVIQPRSPRYNIRVGRWLKPMEKQLFKSIDKVWGHPTVLKGYNAHELGEILYQKYRRVNVHGDCVMVGIDASRFDQHVSLEALQVEHKVYVGCAKYGREELGKLLELQLWNHGSARTKDGRLSYVTRGCRMSGDMNTGMGNCLLMCMLVRQFMLENGISGELANNGDDCVLFVRRKCLSTLCVNLKPWFLKYGFEMTMETPVSKLEEMEFCQQHCLFDGTRWVTCRNFPNFVSKDVNTILPLDRGDCLQGYAGAISDCGTSLSGGLPIYQAFYQGLDTISGGVRLEVTKSTGWESGFVRLSRGMDRKRGDVKPEARLSFYRAFKVLPDHQLILEAKYRDWGTNFNIGTRGCRLGC